MGDFVDFCLGPHLPSTSHIKAVKLKPEPAGAYWKGKEGNPSMQRIYGYAFFTRDELDQHLHRLEEAKRRDPAARASWTCSRSADETGAGLILWHPKGGFIRKQMEDFCATSTCAAGTNIVYSPHIARLDLWKTSGPHRVLQGEHVLPIEIENVEYQLKPMNCPFHIMIFKNRLRSYRDLAVPLAELGTGVPLRASGVLHGLMRVRGSRRTTRHLFCRPDQLDAEVVRVLDFVTHILRSFGFDRYDIFLSTKPEKASGTDEQWGVATASLSGRWSCASSSTPWIPARGLLRAEDRHQDQGLARPRLAVLHDPGRLPQPEPVPDGVHRRGRQGAPAGDDPPRAPWAAWSGSSAS